MVLLAAVAFYATIQFSWLLRALLDSEFFPRSAIDRGIRDSIKKLLHYSVVLIGLIFALSLLGVTPQNFVVLAGAFGIGIGFGLQNIVNNFVSGLILLFERPIKVGDMVMIDGEWALVRKIGLRSTTIETFDLSEIIVPNSDLISQKVINWTLSSEQSRVVVPVGVAYGSDVPLVLTILKECADRHPKVLDTPAPSIIFTAFGNSSLDFELRVWVADINMRLAVKSDLLLTIDEQFRLATVEIPFPQQDLHLRSIDSTLLASVTSGRKAPNV
jgi:small-conductance mechanosensitive channel